MREIVVLDGTAWRRECRWRNEVCPGLRVRWDEAQDPDRPVDAAFLRAFDAWVEEARREGKRIAFRCWQGWHRAGRLAAYYRIRFDGWTAEAAIREMHRRGRMMAAHPGLDPQVRALADFAAGRTCSVDLRYCVAGDAPAEASFPEDACPADLRPSSSGQ
ncbi:MAG: hypothetical protein D6718_04205 [Acidobacteria bacterium]|nr:MAG: hypothetical protein D6718_04205 [Acidobacteriota bacterium]